MLIAALRAQSGRSEPASRPAAAGTWPRAQRRVLLCRPAGLPLPSEHLSHARGTVITCRPTLASPLLCTACLPVSCLAHRSFYGWRMLNPDEVRRPVQPASIGSCWNKWWFDELYDVMFVRPAVGDRPGVAAFDQRWHRRLDRRAGPCGRSDLRARLDDLIDRTGRRPGQLRWPTGLTLGHALRVRADRPAAAVRDVHRRRHGGAVFVIVTLFVELRLGSLSDQVFDRRAGCSCLRQHRKSVLLEDAM